LRFAVTPALTRNTWALVELPAVLPPSIVMEAPAPSIVTFLLRGSLQIDLRRIIRA